MINYISYIAAILTSIAFIPKAYTVYKTKQTRDLVFSTLLIFFISQICWLIVGINYLDYGMITTSLMNIIVYTYLLYAKYYFDNNNTFRPNVTKNY